MSIAKGQPQSLLTEQLFIRNFSIIAHIDHGKTTLSDRLLELTNTIARRQMTELVLDSMELEREKGITIKARAVRLQYPALDGNTYQLNLIDTPGHVDFAYEVSRSLAACEGAILVVDATQGIQAQTLANVYLALEHDLVIIPVINKIDLPNAQTAAVAKHIEEVIGIPQSETLQISAKEGTGVVELLEAIVQRVPAPMGQVEQPLRALVFDSHYDSYKGVVTYVRVVDGSAHRRANLMIMATGKTTEALEIGCFTPIMTPVETLRTGEVGYVATGLKNVADSQVGDTITDKATPAESPLVGYRPAKPMVFAGLYPIESNDYQALREALGKLGLNDASLHFEPESSNALGFGFRCGFLGLLHMEIVRERLEREFGLNLLITAPSVEYRVTLKSGQVLSVDNPSQLPPAGDRVEIAEPWMELSIIAPSKYIGVMMEMVISRRGQSGDIEYIDDSRVLMKFSVPLSEILVEFYDQLKSNTHGYASMDYTFDDHRVSDLVQLEILVQGQSIDALSMILHRDRSYIRGKELVQKLRRLIPRQLFDVAVQAAIGSRVIARETVPATRKNVLAKCYGGDVTRKRKLLERQAEGKKRLKRVGNVEIPQEAFLAVLKLDE